MLLKTILMEGILKLRSKFFVASKTRDEFLIKSRLGRKFRVPRDLTRKLVRKTTGFTSESDVLHAICRAIDNKNSKAEWSNIYRYTFRFEKFCKKDNCMYSCTLEVHVKPESGLVSYIALGRNYLFLAAAATH